VLIASLKKEFEGIGPRREILERKNSMSTQPKPVVRAHPFPAVEERLLTLKQASCRLGISLRTLEDWIYDKKIEVVKLGRRCVRVKESTIAQIIELGTRPAHAGLS
jgi:excisionase family DNA binding protein